VTGLSAETVLWRCLALQQRLESIPSRPLAHARGLQFGARCIACRRPAEEARLEEYDAERRASRWLCMHCGCAWPVNVAFLLRGGLHETRRSGRADELAELATLRAILERLTARQQVTYLLLYQYENIRDFDLLAAALRSRFPRMAVPHGSRGPRPEQWSAWAARTVVTESRARITAEIRARGLAPALVG